MQYWQTTLGDSLVGDYNTGPVRYSDIYTRHLNDRSIVQVNINNRNIKAHNLNYYAKTDVKAMNITHNAAFVFSLNDTPSSSNSEKNGQAIQAGLFIWDGSSSKTEYAVAFRWVVDPWSINYGQLYTWTGNNWQFRASITPDTTDHNVEIEMDRIDGIGILHFDDQTFTNAFSTMVPEDQPSGVTARLEFSAINATASQLETNPSFSVNFKNWKWEWSY